MENSEIKNDWSMYIENRPYYLGTGVRVFFEDDVPYAEVYFTDKLNLHESGVKIPVQSYIKWVAANVSGAKEYKRSITE